jgi:hypothetical protein
VAKLLLKDCAKREKTIPGLKPVTTHKIQKNIWEHKYKFIQVRKW